MSSSDEKMPCLRAFLLDRAFPESVRGPVDRWEPLPAGGRAPGRISVESAVGSGAAEVVSSGPIAIVFPHGFKLAHDPLWAAQALEDSRGDTGLETDPEARRRRFCAFACGD